MCDQRLRYLRSISPYVPIALEKKERKIMKCVYILSSLLFAVTASAMDIPMNSVMGQHLLTKARKLEQNGDDNANQEVDYSWIAGYSMKFQGCHHIKQWNDNADDENDVRISTTRLIRFRLCPSDTCSASKAGGCSGGYGDYVIDMDTFMNAYWEAKRKSIEYNCEYFMENSCGCNNDDNQDDNFNRDYCEFDCYNDAGMTECIDRNPYEDDQDMEEFNYEEYMECKELDVPENDDDDGNNRRLEQDDEVRYYVGPYCADQGGEVRLGLFSDDSCSEFEYDVTFEELMGFELPYSSESFVGAECLGCLEQDNDQNQNDDQDEDRVIESCENLYMGAGKCEANLPYGMVEEPNTNACNYMEGIRIVRADGIVDTGSTRPSSVATAFIVMFAMGFAAMAFYVWYLRTRLGVRNALL